MEDFGFIVFAFISDCSGLRTWLLYREGRQQSFYVFNVASLDEHLVRILSSLSSAALNPLFHTIRL